MSQPVDRGHCEEDDGLRECCGTRQLAPHAAGCPMTPSMREAIDIHELMYWHETEAT
jgi:hypothetical protein